MAASSSQIWLADRLAVPASTKALLFDMDGVLLDTLALDYEVVNATLARHTDESVVVSTETIRSYFAFDAPAFWQRILSDVGLSLDDTQFKALLRDYNALRASSTPAIHAGVVEIITAARNSAMRVAVVSNNPEAEVVQMLTNVGIIALIDEVVGNDKPGIAKKPAPDPYLEAASRLSVNPGDCVVIEDSLLGSEAGHRAGCYTVGVATGGATVEQLSSSGFVDNVYESFASVAPRRLSVRPAVSRAKAYVPDWLGLDRSECVRLDRNEASGPLSDTVQLALSEYVGSVGVHMYPDSDPLLQPLSAYCDIEAECILPTNGSDQAIDLTLRAFLNAGETVLMARPEFPVFGQIIDTIGARVTAVPYNADLSFPYEAFRSAFQSNQIDLIVLINPNNPTGTPIERSFIEEVLTENPTTPVIVDEAYYEFTGATVVDLVRQHHNLIVLRTFSKAFAMAGLRLGYAVANEATIVELTKLRNPFDVNQLAVIAGLVQLSDLKPSREYVDETMNRIKPRALQFFESHDIVVHGGAANFVLVESNDRDALVKHLTSSRVLVRPMSAPALSNMFRMSLGSSQDMARFEQAFETFANANKSYESRAIPSRER